MLFSLVNYRRVIIVRSVSTECINGGKHKGFHAMARRTLELDMGPPQPAGVVQWGTWPLSQALVP